MSRVFVGLTRPAVTRRCPAASRGQPNTCVAVYDLVLGLGLSGCVFFFFKRESSFSLFASCFCGVKRGRAGGRKLAARTPAGGIVMLYVVLFFESVLGLTPAPEDTTTITTTTCRTLLLNSITSRRLEPGPHAAIGSAAAAAATTTTACPVLLNSVTPRRLAPGPHAAIGLRRAR